MVLERCLINIYEGWGLKDPHRPVPISFTQKECTLNDQMMRLHLRELLLAEEFLPAIGIGKDGEVAFEELNKALRKNILTKEEFLRTVPLEERGYWSRRWPFQDGAFSPSAESCR